VAEHTSAASVPRWSNSSSATTPRPSTTRAETHIGEVMADIVGADRVLNQEPTMGGEDFAYTKL
jgi:hippurate hydrolase